MSALGQKQTCAAQKVMSALPPKADMCCALVDVRFVPIADIAPAARSKIKRPPTEAASHCEGARRLGSQGSDPASAGSRQNCTRKRWQATDEVGHALPPKRQQAENTIMAYLTKLHEAEAEIAAPNSDPWRLPLERVRGKAGDDGIERVTSQMLFDILDVPQRSRGAGRADAWRRSWPNSDGPLYG